MREYKVICDMSLMTMTCLLQASMVLQVVDRWQRPKYCAARSLLHLYLRNKRSTRGHAGIDLILSFGALQFFDILLIAKWYNHLYCSSDAMLK